MTTGTAEPEAAAEPGTSARAGAAPLVVLGLLYVVAAVTYTLIALRSPIPVLVPDEITYGTLANSVADGDGLTIRGVEIDLRSALYVYAIAPAWKVASGSDAFEIAQAIGAALLCLTAFPVWLLARRYIGAWLALLPAVLVLSGTWMLTAAGLFTENLALPLSAATLAATVVAVSRPGSRWMWVALAGALLAALARSQMAVLFPVIALAVAADCARHREAWRERLRAHRVLAAVSAGLTLAGVIVVSSSPGSLGIYEGLEQSPGSEPIFDALKNQLIALLALSAVLPVVLVAAASARTEPWRDPRVGPLLAVTWSAVLLFLLESAWIVGWAAENENHSWHIQRYIEYPLPLLLVAMAVVVRTGRARPREIVIAGGIVTLFLLTTPGLGLAQEERGLFSVFKRFNALLGTSPAVSLALASALLTAVALGATVAVRRPATVLVVITGTLLVTFAVQSQTAWDWQTTTSRALGDVPHVRTWVDDAADGAVARLLAVSNAPNSVMTQLFNHDVDRAYVPEMPLIGPPVVGRQCKWTPNQAGVIAWGAGCGGAPRRVLLDDTYARIHFHDQRVLAGEPRIGRLVELTTAPPAQPRLKAILRVPCSPAFVTPEVGGKGGLNPPRATCDPVIAGGFWLDEPGSLVLRFRGGSRPLRIAFGNGARVEVIKPGVVNTLTVPVSRGASSFNAQLEWNKFGPGFPELVGAELVGRDGDTMDLLY